MIHRVSIRGRSIGARSGRRGRYHCPAHLAETLLHTLLSTLVLVGMQLIGVQAGPEPTELIAQGAFEEAYLLALREGGSAELVTAARAASFLATYRLKERAEQLSWLERAVAAAEQAVAEDPTSAAAHFELARAVGLQAQLRGFPGNLDAATRLRHELERALELDPDHPDALAALGKWHLELVERGVAFLYGAERQRVLPLLARAVEVDPERVGLRVEYADALLRLGEEEEARTQLQIALSLPAEEAADRYERARAEAMLQGLP